MRSLAAILTSVAGSLLAGAAFAADDGQALYGAAFADPIAFKVAQGLGVSSASDLARYQPGVGLVRFSSDEVAAFIRPDVSYSDSVRVSTVALDALPGAALLRGAGAARPAAYDVTYVRKWPSVISTGKGHINVDLTPHAGLGVSSGGGRSAEAGALLRMMNAIGMGGRDAPRWYVFAGYRKRLVGINLVRGEEMVRRERLANEGMVRDIQAGLGAHRGRFHALLGYTHETVSMRSLGDSIRDDDRIGLNLSFR